MAIDLYKAFSNPVTGESFRCLVYNEHAFVFEFIVQPGGVVPFEHIHLNQDEIFHIKSGEVRIVLDGVEHIAKAGDSVVVPAGAKHIAFNNKPEVLKCVVEFKPGLDHYQFFQCFAGLTIDNDIDKKGQINIPKMLFFSKKMKAKCTTRPTSIPAPIFRLATEICFIIGILAGWEKLFNKYTK